MLILGRRPEESIEFPGTGIKIIVLNVRGDNVRIGIEAPKEVRVLRSELLTKEPNETLDIHNGPGHGPDKEEGNPV